MASLPSILARMARTYPAAVVRQIAAHLAAGQSALAVGRNLHLPQARGDFEALKCALLAQPLGGVALSLALLTALEAHENNELSAPELVWTGPITVDATWRRTDAALLEVIQSARHSLWLVTFAVHGGQILRGALAHAAARGVQISFVCETQNSGKIRVDNREKVRDLLPASAAIYEWPTNKRGRNQDGNFGTLHAKIAVADHDLALISSANLTDCALDFNLESGVLLRGALAAKIAEQLEQLVARGIWQPVFFPVENPT